MVGACLQPIKGMAIWISAGNEFKSGKNIDPINLFSAWIPGDIHLESDSRYFGG